MSSSTNPPSVKIARKRGADEQEPPNTLIVQARDGDATDGGGAVYIRQKRRDVSIRTFGGKHEGDAAFAPPSGPRNELTRRLFALKRKDQPDDAAITGKRGRDDVATFVEQRTSKSARGARPGADGEEEGEEVPQYGAAPERAFKRPSRQPRARREVVEEEGAEAARPPQTEAQRREMEALAQYLHAAALEEVRREAKVTPPRISGQRARELHRARVEGNARLAAASQQQQQRRRRPPEDADMGDGGEEYVYDTYVLAPPTTDFAALPAHASDVGYLVISPADRDAWATYLDERAPGSDDDEEGRRSDDEDENAEDYYGADYPEDELSADDEAGRVGVYGREGEGEESEGSAWSEEEEEEEEEEREVERMMNPFAWRGPRLAGVRRRLEGGEGGGGVA